jgi:signal transduction histidine kinase
LSPFALSNDPFEQLASAGFISPRAGIESSVKAWLANRPDNTRLVLFIDQFEELFVSTPKDIRLNFIAELARLLDSHCSITVAFTLRDDFYSKFLGEAINLTGWLERGLVNIPPTLDKDDIRTIIIQPAQSVGIIFDEGLVDVIINDSCEVDKKRGFARSTILPLLEFTLTQLWQHREKNQLTHSAYRNNGEVVGSLTIWADHVYYELTEFERTLARNILTGLVHLGVEKQGIPDSRSTRPINSLVRLDDNVAFEVIDKLIRSRILLSFRNVENGDESIEIIHDAFLIEWSLLRKWLDEEQFVLRLRETVREAAVDWENGTRDESYLIHRGKRLDELIAISANSRFVFTISEQAYINACVLIHEKESISETTIIKDQLATRASLAWAGLATSAWRHAINRDAVMIRNVVDQIRQERDRDNELSGLSELSIFDIRLDKIEQLAKRIGDVPNLTPLSSEEGVELVFVDKIVKERLPHIIEFRTVGKVKFELQLDPKPLAKVRISPEWFTKSFDILIDNALDAVSNRNSGIIVVSTVYGQKIVEVKIQDNGSGIDKEIRENLFRTSIPKKSGEKESGIGLLMASAIVQSYGGNIRLESSGPLGTSMVISLPLA